MTCPEIKQAEHQFVDNSRVPVSNKYRDLFLQTVRWEEEEEDEGEEEWLAGAIFPTPVFLSRSSVS